MKRPSCLVYTLGFLLLIASLVWWRGSAQRTRDWVIETVDNTGAVGEYTSLTLDSAGRPHISYHADRPHNGLKYAYYNGSIWTIQAVDSAPNLGNVGGYTSLVLDEQDHPHISYLDWSNGLKYAYYDGSLWRIETVDSTRFVGAYSSLALDTEDHPHIGYHDYTNRALKYAWHDGYAWHIETVVSAGREACAQSGEHASLALDMAGFPHISYFDSTANELKYAYRDRSAWHIETVDRGKSGYAWVSLVLDSAGQPYISYLNMTDRDLMYAYREDTAWRVDTVDRILDVGYFSSLALDPAGNPHISYTGSRFLSVFRGNVLKYAWHNGATWQIEEVDTLGHAGGYPSMALDAADRPHISYCEYDHNYFACGALKYAHRPMAASQMDRNALAAARLWVLLVTGTLIGLGLALRQKVS